MPCSFRRLYHFQALVTPASNGRVVGDGDDSNDENIDRTSLLILSTCYAGHASGGLLVVGDDNDDSSD